MGMQSWGKSAFWCMRREKVYKNYEYFYVEMNIYSLGRKFSGVFLL